MQSILMSAEAMATKKKSNSKGRTDVIPNVTRNQWIAWARETFTCLEFYFHYNVLAEPSNDMFSLISDDDLPDWAKWRAVKKSGVLPIKRGKQHLRKNKDRRMLTREEIYAIKRFNLSTVREGLRQAEQRLHACFDGKKALESKAHILLSIFVSITAALFSVSHILKVNEPTIHLATILTSLCLLVGVLCLFRSLALLDYGILGRYPDTWLRPGVLNGDDNTQARVLAMVLHDYQISIGASDNSHRDKVRWFNKGMASGVVALAIFLASLVKPYVVQHPVWAILVLVGISGFIWYSIWCSPKTPSRPWF